jgi:hypothetical protein
VINAQRFEPERLAHETLHNFRGFDHDAIGGVGPSGGAGAAHDLGGALRMVPMAVRDPKFSQPTFFRGQDWLNRQRRFLQGRRSGWPRRGRRR